MVPQSIKEEMQHVNGLVIEGWTWPWALLHRLSMNVKYALQSSKLSSWSFSGMEDDGWNRNIERTDRLIISLSQKPMMANTVLTMLEATTKWLETYPVMPMTSPRILSWALKIKCCSSMTPQKELSQKMGQFLKQPHRHLGKRAWHWMGMFTLKWKHWTHMISVMVIQEAVLSDTLFQLSECISSERSGH